MLIYSETSFAFIRKCEKYLKEIIQTETELSFRKTRFLYKNHYYPLHIVVFEGEQKLGYFNPKNYQIGLNKCLIYTTKEKVLKDILRHEFAHYLTFIFYGNVQHHGEEYNSVCTKYNWPKEVSEASLNLKAANENLVGDLNAEKIMTKIKNLLKLASSDNPHEAELATIKANQLLLKYNLEMVDPSLDEQTYYVHKVLTYKRKNAKMGTIYSILKHFMVSPVLNYSKGEVSLEVTGLKTNIELADYVASFLDEELERLWEQTKKENNLKGKVAKNSFFRGVELGYEEKMQSLKSELSENHSQSLIIIERKLQEKVSQIYGGLRSGHSQNQLNLGSMQAGKKAGKNLTINKGIKNQSLTQLLGWKR